MKAGPCKLILSGFACEVSHKTKSLNAIKAKSSLSLPKRLPQFMCCVGRAQGRIALSRDSRSHCVPDQTQINPGI